MGYWIEIICDVRTPSENARYEAHCWSNRNANPGVLSNNTAGERSAAIRMMEAEARENGWRRRRSGWICPGCIAAQESK